MKVESVTRTTEWSEFLHHTVVVLPIRFPDRVSCRIIPLTPENIEAMREKVEDALGLPIAGDKILAAIGITEEAP